jgi:hypothetical protein
MPYIYWSEKYFEQKLWRKIKYFILGAVLFVRLADLR